MYRTYALMTIKYFRAKRSTIDCTETVYLLEIVLTSNHRFDQDELAESFVRTFRNQIFAPGQQLLMDFKSIPLRMTIRTVELVDLSSLNASGGAQTQTNPQSRGILVNETAVNYFKDAKSPINIKGSTKRPAANSVVRPDFKFEDMGELANLRCKEQWTCYSTAPASFTGVGLDMLTRTRYRRA